jgi:hypothetical protein
MTNCNDYLDHIESIFEQANEKYKNNTEDEINTMYKKEEKEYLTHDVEKKFDNLLKEFNDVEGIDFCAKLTEAKFENNGNMAIGLNFALVNYLKEQQKPTSVPATPQKSTLMNSTASSRAQAKQNGGNILSRVSASPLVHAGLSWYSVWVITTIAVCPPLAANLMLIPAITLTIRAFFASIPDSNRPMTDSERAYRLETRAGGGPKDEKDICKDIDEMINVLPEDIKQIIDKQVAETQGTKPELITAADTSSMEAIRRGAAEIRAKEAAEGGRRKTRRNKRKGGRKTKKSKTTRKSKRTKKRKTTKRKTTKRKTTKRRRR